MEHFYTRKGDDGMTGFLGEGRLPKDDLRFEALGNLDECSAHCGILRALLKDDQDREMVMSIQRDLYHLMAETAADKTNAVKFRSINAERVFWLEEQVERLSASTMMPSEFILPGETLLGAEVSVTRAVVRRAERSLTTLVHQGTVENTFLLQYLNRLSSLLFALEVKTSTQPGHPLATAGV